MSLIKGFLINLQFFTALPIHLQLPMDKRHLEKSIQTIPFVGLLQGILYSLFLYLVIEWTPFSILAAAFFLWLLTIIITGGLHLDGWMDASDAYFSYQDKAKRLEIMSDPRTGAFGVLSVIVLLSSRFFFIYEMIGFLTLGSYLFILLLPILSRMVMGTILVMVPAAKKEGLAALFQEAGSRRSILIYPVYLVMICLFVLWQAPSLLTSLVIMLGVAILCYRLIAMKAGKWFGGITGDVVGASVEGTEIILWMTLWLLHCFAMV